MSVLETLDLAMLHAGKLRMTTKLRLIDQQMMGNVRVFGLLTVLTCASLSADPGDDADDDDEEALIESWTPRFRR
jgi:hypothetical protein